MKQILMILAVLMAGAPSFAQKTFEPQILILSPNHVKADTVFGKEIADLNLGIRQRQGSSKDEKELSSKEFSKNPGNIQLMMQNEVAYAKTLDFYNLINYLSEQFLAYRFIEKFPNLMIRLSTVKSEGQLPELKRLAEQEHLQYILNFPQVEFYKQDGVSYARL